MERPLISVIIPSYNSANTIAEAIRSMTDQTYKNLEVLIIDDGSTDNTKDIVEAIGKKDARIKYILLPYKDPHRIDWRGINVNAGYMARNYGIEKATGEWITFQDADDGSLLNRIEAQYELAKKYKAIHVSVQWQQFIKELANKKLDIEKIFRERGQETIIIGPEEIVSLAKAAKGVLMSSWFPHNIIPFTVKKWFPGARRLFWRTAIPYPGTGGAPLVKREVFEKVKFRKINDRVWGALSGRGADRDFNFQVAETFKNSISAALPLYLYRTQSQNPDFIGYEKYLID